jgi:hypothetical protein
MSSASNQDSSVRPSKRFTPRERWALCALGLFALLAFVLWRPVRHYVLTAGVLRSDAPSEAVMTEVVDGAAQPARALEQIWRAGSFSGRSFVVRQLLLRLNSDAALVRQMKPLLEEAAFDADLEVRETAFSVLAQQKHPALRRWLQAQVNDPDPAVRVIALQQLARIATTNDVSVAIPLLDDPDARVIVAAGGMLKRVTGDDFGLKTAQALPMFAWKPENPPSAVDWSLINRGRDGWWAWWRLHQAEFPAGDGLPRPGPALLPAPHAGFRFGRPRRPTRAPVGLSRPGGAAHFLEPHQPAQRH